MGAGVAGAGVVGAEGAAGLAGAAGFGVAAGEPGVALGVAPGAALGFVPGAAPGCGRPGVGRIPAAPGAGRAGRSVMSRSSISKMRSDFGGMPGCSASRVGIPRTP